jgi:hypothetical protein
MEAKPTDESPPKPIKLYKYRTFADDGFAEAMASKGELYFASPRKFNDPFDCNPSMMASSAILMQLDPETGKWVETRFEDLGKKSLAVSIKISHRDPEYNEFFDQWSIVSLSLIPDHPLMWSHYSNCHTGICVEFELAVNQLGKGISVHKVEYTDDRPPFGPMQVASENPGFFIGKILTTKSNVWAYEQEVRLIRSGAPGVSSDHGLKVTGLIAGCRTSLANLKRAAEWANEIGVQLKQAHIVKRHYKLFIDDPDSLIMRELPLPGMPPRPLAPENLLP